MSQSDLSALNARYGIPAHVSFKEGPGGLTVAEVNNTRGNAVIALQGAQVMSWAPRGAQPVIWVSPAAKFAAGKSMRGGVPLCWPWFGPHVTEAGFPAHGFARTAPWAPVKTEALAEGATRLVFSLTPNEASRVQWPYATPVECHITVGATLEIDLVTRNSGDAPVTIGQALHTYFNVSDIRQVTVTGLDACSYLDKVDGGKRKQQNGPVDFTGETDRIYLGSSDDCVIEDPGLQRRIRISKRGSRSTVVWNPWMEKAAKMGDLGDDGYLRMLCVESANAADDVVEIAPGAAHHLWVRYSLEAAE